MNIITYFLLATNKFEVDIQKWKNLTLICWFLILLCTLRNNPFHVNVSLVPVILKPRLGPVVLGDFVCRLGMRVFQQRTKNPVNLNMSVLLKLSPCFYVNTYQFFLNVLYSTEENLIIFFPFCGSRFWVLYGKGMHDLIDWGLRLLSWRDFINASFFAKPFNEKLIRSHLVVLSLYRGHLFD